MAVCDCCGNDYERSMRIEIGNKTHTFDSFECAIHMLAPTCVVCGCRVIGHGTQAGEEIYCCAHCARRQGEHSIRDRAS